MSTDMSQVGVTLSLLFNIFYHFTFPGFPFIFIFINGIDVFKVQIFVEMVILVLLLVKVVVKWAREVILKYRNKTLL